MSAVTIRAAVQSDVEDAYRLMAGLGYPDLDRPAFQAVFDELLNRGDMTILLAENTSGRVVGLASVSHRPQLHLTGIVVSLDELVVSDEARGLGAGRELLDRVKQMAGELGARRLELHTNRGRESYKRGFYPKNGFFEANSALMRLVGDVSEPRK